MTFILAVLLLGADMVPLQADVPVARLPSVTLGLSGGVPNGIGLHASVWAHPQLTVEFDLSQTVGVIAMGGVVGHLPIYSGSSRHALLLKGMAGAVTEGGGVIFSSTWQPIALVAVGYGILWGRLDLRGLIGTEWYHFHRGRDETFRGLPMVALQVGVAF